MLPRWHVDREKCFFLLLCGILFIWCYHGLYVAQLVCFTQRPLATESRQPYVKSPIDKPQILLYNRVPKTGSKTMSNLIYKLANKNNFTCVFEKSHTQIMLPSEQKQLMANISRMVLPVIYIEHFWYIDINQTEYDENQIKYINLFRDPYARVVSNYYFEDHLGKGVQGCQNLTIDDCIKTGNMNSWIVSALPFFCGQSAKCLLDRSYRLSKAIENVKKHYIAVGLLEYLNETLAVFEYLLPTYFLEARTIFDRVIENEKGHAHEHTWQKAESDESRAYLKARLQEDDEFYEFLRNRLMSQYSQFVAK